MLELEPASPELIAWYRMNIVEYRQIADDCRIPRFSEELRCNVLKLVNDPEAVDLIEFAARIGNFGDAREIAERREAVAKLLKKRGVKMRRGKRSTYGLPELVGRLAPLLLHFGVPLGVGDNSCLVKGLRAVALCMGVSGDPRDELRRLKRIKLRRKAADAEVFLEGFVRGLEP